MYVCVCVCMCVCVWPLYYCLLLSSCLVKTFSMSDTASYFHGGKMDHLELEFPCIGPTCCMRFVRLETIQSCLN